MARVSPAIGSLRGFMGIKRHADGAIANSMDVHLKALAIQAGDEFIQPFGVEIEFSAAAVTVQVWLNQRCGSGFDDAIGEDFYSSSAHTLSVKFGPPLDQAN